MKKIIITLILIGPMTYAGFMPPVPESQGNKEELIWKKYCTGNRESTEVPAPNYKDATVISAATKLSLVAPLSYYFYSGPLYAYGLKKNKELIDPPKNFPKVKEVKDGKKNAHAFLTLLCGEFRDRPSMIEKKINWVNNMNYLPNKKQAAIDVKKDLWNQMTALSYTSYVKNSKSIFEAKIQKNEDEGKRVTLGRYSEDYPVEPYSVCETKYIFKEYVETNKEFPGGVSALNKYLKAYEKFKKQCSKEDLDYFYDFRGDSNFKPNSPESNAMIWYSSAITANCQRADGKIVVKDNATIKMDDSTCINYFTKPFEYRWAAAKAGLTTWLMRDKEFDEVFADTAAKVTIIPHLEPSQKPFAFKTEDSSKKITKLMTEWEKSKSQFWVEPDLGFNTIMGLGTAQPDIQFTFERLRDSVNRHTDWYASAYDDGSGKVREQAYSPFVASSYEIGASDAFTAPGVTVQSPSDGCKHWMFIFKLHKDQWYNTKSVAEGRKIDFNHNWLDETSLGTNHLADSEHAMDRLGTALENEMDAILYLHNITTDGRVDSKCGQEFM